MRTARLSGLLEPRRGAAVAAAHSLFDALVERRIANAHQFTVMIKACRDSRRRGGSWRLKWPRGGQTDRSDFRGARVAAARRGPGHGVVTALGDELSAKVVASEEDIRSERLARMRTARLTRLLRRVTLPLSMRRGHCSGVSSAVA